MNELKVFIPGEPCAQGRPRFSTAGGFVRAYDPAKSRNYKAYVKAVCADAAEKHGWLFNTDLPLEVEIIAGLSIPSSKSKKWKQAAAEGVEKPTKKPDIDNLVKIIMDALSGVIYKDDKQIIKMSVEKRYAEQPGVTLEVRVLNI